MRKFIFLLLICSLFLAACNNKEDQSSDIAGDDYFVYEINEPIMSFDIDESGVLYYSTSNENENHNYTYYIKALDFSGSLINTYETDNSPNTIALDGSNIYYSVNTETGISFYRLSLNSKETVKLADIADYSSIKQMAVIDGKIYFLGNNVNYINKQFNLADSNDRLTYSGEALGCFDLNNLEYTELEINLPLLFSKTTDGNLLIYAYDEEGGYYFVEYNTKDGSFGNKTFHKIDSQLKFAVYNEENDFVYQKFSDNTLILAAASVEPSKGETDLVPNLMGGAHLLYFNGYIFITNINTTKIIRLKIKSYMYDNKKITMLSNDFYDVFLPFGCGYTIEQQFLSDEEMALVMLSQDKNYDIYFVNSAQSISENIKNKGAFYPLNEVEGVQEYLDACFPYIRDAATNSDGDIWMLPISVDIPVLFYNEKTCRENNIELSNSIDIEAFFATLRKLGQDEKLSQLYCYDRVGIIDNLFKQYLRVTKDFDSDSFRKLAVDIKNSLIFSEFRGIGNFSLFAEFSSNVNNDFALLQNNDHTYQYNVADRNTVRACALPVITDNKSNIANCFFFCVNPESKNLKETLGYISAYCEYLLLRKELMIFKDRSLYPQTAVMDDLYNIYSNGDIQFTMPDELYTDNFNEYLKGNMELDDFIKEANRKLDVFLNE